MHHGAYSTHGKLSPSRYRNKWLLVKLGMTGQFYVFSRRDSEVKHHIVVSLECLNGASFCVSSGRGLLARGCLSGTLRCGVMSSLRFSV